MLWRCMSAYAAGCGVACGGGRHVPSPAGLHWQRWLWACGGGRAHAGMQGHKEWGERGEGRKHGGKMAAAVVGTHLVKLTDGHSRRCIMAEAWLGGEDVLGGRGVS
jgi:hypothetical protein